MVNKRVSFLVPLAVSIVLIVVLYYPVFFKSYWAVNSSDAVQLHLPNNLMVVNSFRKIELPLWNPNFNLGQPTIDGSTTIFHPFLILYFLFKPWMANTIEVLLGLFLTCLGIWYFLREQNINVFPAIIGIFVYVLSGPVFFLHSYHLGFMAPLILPWLLILFHRYDSTKSIRWLWIASFLCILAVQSLDFDTLFYLYLGLVIDRIVCLPKYETKDYIIKWVVIFLLTALTGFVLYLPFYQWLVNSSRITRSYAGILPPGFLNTLSAIVTNNWVSKWPYDVFYFYFGPGIIWLFVAGLKRLNTAFYAKKYLLFSLIMPLIYITAILLRFHALDLWRGMFVFCLGLSIIAARGTSNILNARFYEILVTVIFSIVTLIIALWSIFQDMSFRITAVLLLAFFGMIATVLSITGNKKKFGYIGVSVTMIATLLIPAVHYTVGTFSCVRYNTEITENLPLYNLLSKDTGGKTGHWRVSIFGCSYNLTSLAGLKTLPNYTPIYNKKFEESLCQDNLIPQTRVHPYWMNLKSSDAEKLSFYGVRFLVTNDYDLCSRAPWDDVCPEWSKKGWVERKDISWPKHKIWENSYYIGRSYIITSEGFKKSGVEFLKDSPTSVILKAKTDNNDLLVLADLYYQGWQAYVDGEAVPSEVYHNCLRAVRLKKGEHVVRWQYDSKIERLGLLFSSLAVCLLILYLILLSAFCKDRDKNKSMD